MDEQLKEAVHAALDGEAILFLGAGFSIGGINKSGKPMLNAADLSKEMCRVLKLEESPDIAVVSERFINDPKCGKGIDALIDFLKSQLICIQTSEVQDVILSVPWQRIYTTNYDNVVEVSSKKQKIRRRSLTVSGSVTDFKDIESAIVHMNGYIVNLTSKKFFNEFKITEDNYLNVDFMDSPWGRQFEHDINYCRNIFFIGYSMRYDLDLQKVMYNRIRDKSIFIDRKQLDGNQEYRLNKWGQLYKIEAEGFAETIKQIRTEYIPKPPKRELMSLTEINPSDYIPKTIKAAEVLDLLTFGKYDRLWFRTSDEFFLKREEHIENIIRNFDTHNICLVHADLGNGKTVFLDCLISRLIEENDVFIPKNDEHIADDLRELGKRVEARQVIVLDNYEQHMNFFREYADAPFPNIKIVAACRSSLNILLLDQIQSKYRLDSKQIFLENVNELGDSECARLIKLMNHYQLWGRHANLSGGKKIRLVKDDYHSRLSEVFYMLLDSQSIKSKLKQLFDKLEDEVLKKYVFALSVCEICHFELQTYEICRLINIAPSAIESLTYDRELRSMFDNARFRSAIFAQYTIRTLDNKSELLNVIKQMYRRSMPEHGKKYFMLRRTLTSRTSLLPIFNNSYDEQSLYDYYDSIREYAKGNPFYWLQFAITALNLKRYTDAKLYFENAYSYADQLESFDTFQLDTHYARYLLEDLELASEPNFAQFYSAHRKLMDNSNSNTRLAYVLRHVGVYRRIYEKYGEQFSAEQTLRFWECVDEVNRKFESYFRALQHEPRNGANSADKRARKSYLFYRNLLEGNDELKTLNELYQAISW